MTAAGASTPSAPTLTTGTDGVDGTAADRATAPPPLRVRPNAASSGGRRRSLYELIAIGLAALLSGLFLAVAIVCGTGPDPFVAVAPAALSLFCGIFCALLAGGE